MASLVYAHDGGRATQDTKFYTGTVAGAVTYDSGTTLGDTAGAFKHNTSNPAVTASGIIDAVLADAGRGITCLIKLNALIGAGTEILFTGLTSGGLAVWNAGITSGGLIVIQGVGATAGTGSVALSANTVYRLSMAYHITDTTHHTFTIKAFDTAGTLLDTATVSAGTLTRTASSALRCQSAGAVGIDHIVWYSDLAVDDNTSDADPGEWRVTAKRPNANGTVNTFDTTTSTTNSGYGTGNSIYVNERPAVTTGARRQNATGTVSERFAIENASTGDFDISAKTYIGHMAWAHISGVSTDQIYRNGTATLPTNGNIGSVAFKWSPATSASYPSSSDAVGANRPTSSATDCILNECGMVVVYTTPASRTTQNTRAAPLGMEIGMDWRSGGL